MKKDKFYYKNFTNEEIEEMSLFQRSVLSNQKLTEILNERKPIIDAEPRNWSVQIEDPLIFGVLEEPLKAIKHLMIRTYENSICLFGYEPEGAEPIETFTTIDKINSFIHALIQARDSVFPE